MGGTKEQNDLGSELGQDSETFPGEAQCLIYFVKSIIDLYSLLSCSKRY